MIGIFNTITIDEKEIYRGNDFSLTREFIYAGEIETCTGKRCADLIGWRYADLTINWDMLPETQLGYILGLSGQEVEMTFDAEDGTSITETVIPTAITSTATRTTDRAGNPLWKNIGLGLRFINAHN